MTAPAQQPGPDQPARKTPTSGPSPSAGRRAYQPRVAMGNVPRWLLQNVVITNNPQDMIEDEDIIRALSRQYPRDEMGHWSGHTRAEVFTRARDLIPGFPRITSVMIPGDKRPVRKAMLKGVRLLQPVTDQERLAPHTARPSTPIPDSRTRECQTCQADISDRHFNSVYCKACVKKQKPRPAPRLCLDCDADISDRNFNALRCSTCTPIHVKKYTAEYRTRPEVQHARIQYDQKPETIARKELRKKEKQEERKTARENALREARERKASEKHPT